MPILYRHKVSILIVFTSVIYPMKIIVSIDDLSPVFLVRLKKNLFL